MEFNQLELRIVKGTEALKLIPFIDGRSLEFTGHDGLWLNGWQYEPADRYWYGDFEFAHQENGTWIMGCDCGEAGCAPLEASVTVSPDQVIWSDFHSGNSPRPVPELTSYTFARAQYDEQIRAISHFFH
ncbi:hypothetical protein [Psychromicrobium sp. YIM B11713]|uniref:hypothetical protein n=1 Tax=Psychromicrobium sp. YIM B11713 TaxID=3145233 RepID=UPI00374F3F05